VALSRRRPRVRPGRPLWRYVIDRDARRLALIEQALLNDSDELVLSADDVRQLTAGDHRTATAPERVELGFAVHSADTAAFYAVHTRRRSHQLRWVRNW
jgi:hypothetical protein